MTVHNGKKLERNKMSFDIKMDKLWYIHLTDYYTAMKVSYRYSNTDKS